MKYRAKPGRCGIVIGRDRVIAVVLKPDGRSEVTEWPLDAPGVARVLAEVHTALAGEQKTIGVALLPGVAHVRSIELPPLRTSEMHAVVNRHTSRYFPVVGGDLTIATRRVHGAGSPSTRVIVAAAPEGLVEEIAAAATEHGWSPECAVPASEAWATGAVALWPALRRGGMVIVVDEDRISVLEVGRDSVRDIRTLPADDFARAAGIVAMSRDDNSRASAVGLIGPPDRRARVRERIDAAGPTEARVVEPPAGSLADHPSAFAAVWASQARGLELIPEARRELEVRRERKLAMRLWVAAAALVVVAGGLELWGAHRELAAVRAERETLAPVVAQAMAIRSALTAAEERISAVQALDHATPMWSSLLTGVALHLPEDAYLAALRGRPDSVVLEGVALRSAAVFEALGGMPGVVGVRAESPIRRETTREGGALERFTLAARLRPGEGALP